MPSKKGQENIHVVTTIQVHYGKIDDIIVIHALHHRDEALVPSEVFERHGSRTNIKENKKGTIGRIGGLQKLLKLWHPMIARTSLH